MATIELTAAKQESDLWDAVVVNQDIDVSYAVFETQVLSANHEHVYA
jgi:hypothetical protein